MPTATCNGGQHVNRRGRVVELAAAMVGNDDPIGTQLHRFAGIIRGQDALWGGSVVQGARVLLQHLHTAHQRAHLLTPPQAPHSMQGLLSAPHLEQYRQLGRILEPGQEFPC